MSLPLPEAVELAVGFVRLDAGVERDRPFANVALEAQLRALHLLRLRKVRGFKIDAGELLATTATGSSLVGAHYWKAARKIHSTAPSAPSRPAQTRRHL